MNEQKSDDRMLRFESAIERLQQSVNLAGDDLREVKQAVIGDSKIGLKGLVKEMNEIKSWKAQIDLRVAGIAGGVTVLLLVAKYLFHL